MEVLEREKEKVLDLSGLMCPLPIVITSENIKRLKEGEVITVISTDPGFERDIFNWCKQTGNQLLSLKKEGDKVIAQVKKVSEAVEPSLWYWIKFHSLGVKLHLRHILMMLNPFAEKPDHFITFSAISEGTRAEEYLKGRAKLIPNSRRDRPKVRCSSCYKGRAKGKGNLQGAI
jgi:TusA-related sulfurtransferase